MHSSLSVSWNRFSFRRSVSGEPRLANATAFVRRIEALEKRCLLSGVDWNPMIPPEDIAALETPRQRRPSNPTVAPEGVIPGPEAPAVTGTIEGINFDQDATQSGFYHIPPDTHGAVGPNHVVDAVNTSIEWFTKTGTLQNRQRLGKNGSTAVGSFFAPLNPANGLFDPRVTWDTYNSRFVVVAGEYQDVALGGAVNDSRIFIAVSDDADPNGTWHFTRVNTNLTISGTPTWGDFPALGLDASNLYLTTNQFGYGAGSGFGSRLFIIPKSGFYGGTPGVFPSYPALDPGVLAGIGSLPSSAPAVMIGSTPGSVGTYLVSAGYTSGATDYLSVIAVNPTGPTFTNTYMNLGDISSGTTFAASPQLGAAKTIATNDIRVQNAVWRNGNLYAANTVNAIGGADNLTATARYYRMTTASPTAPVMAEQANIGGEQIAASTRTFFPSIAVNGAGDVAVNFSYVGPNTYAGMAYTVRLNGVDANGAPQAPTVYAAGLGPYVRTFTSGSTGNNRWGDYTSIGVDPSDDSRFWAYGVYALATGTVFGGENGRWGTRWGNFSVATTPAVPSVPDLTDVSDTGTSITDNVTKLTTPTFIGTAIATSTVKLFAGATQVGSAVADLLGNWTITTSALANGTYAFTATATTAGGTSPASPGISVSIDTISPTVASASFVRSPGQVVFVNYSEDLPSGVGAITLTNLTTAATFPVTSSFVDLDTDQFVVNGNAMTDGKYAVTFNSNTLIDSAGNSVLASNPVLQFNFLRADFNNDSSVGFGDLLTLAQNYGTLSGATNALGDVDYNGNVNFGDLLALAQSYGASLSGGTGDDALLVVAAPGAAGDPPDDDDARIASDVL